MTNKLDFVLLEDLLEYDLEIRLKELFQSVSRHQGPGGSNLSSEPGERLKAVNLDSHVVQLGESYIVNLERKKKLSLKQKLQKRTFPFFIRLAYEFVTLFVEVRKLRRNNDDCSFTEDVRLSEQLGVS